MPSLPLELSELLRAQDAPSREQSWARLLERYSGLLLHAARKFGPSYDEAMDRYRYILEELQRDEFRRLKAYEPDGPGKFSTWLLVVAHRLCGDFHRKRYGRLRESGAEQSPARSARAIRWRLQDFVVEPIDPGLLGESNSGDAEDQLRQAELCGALEQAQSGLSPRDRLLLRYRFEDGRSVAEIAALMRYPSVFHVYRRLRALLAELRRRLERGGHDAATP